MLFKSANIILILPIILFFLPAWGILVPGLNTVYTMLYPILYIALLACIIIDKQTFFSRILSLINQKMVKVFFIILLFIALNSILLSLFGITTIFQSLRSIIVQLILGATLFVFYYLYVIDKHISYKNFIYLFLLLLWIDLIIGIICFCSELLNIEIINNIFNVFANSRILKFAHLSYGQTASG